MSSSKPIKDLFKIAALAVSGIILGVGSAYFVSKNVDAPAKLRSVASVGGVRPSRITFGKQAAALNVTINEPSLIPENSNEVVELVGTITQNINGDSGIISYSWELPRGVELVRGPLKGTMSEISLGQPRDVSILVKGFSRTKQRLVSLSCQVQKAGQELTASAVIVSRPEDTAEAHVMELEALARADAEKAKEESPQ